MSAEKVIGRRPRDGREWEPQCARCGSSCVFEDCDNCCGEGEIEDDDWQCEGEFYRCDWCLGAGGFESCCSSREHCEAHPLPGREDIKRGVIEWFTFDPPKAVRS